MEKYIEFNEYFHLIEQLADKIDIDVDYVVGIIRGGYIPADIISRIKKAKLLCLRACSYKDKTQGGLSIYNMSENIPLSGNVILVDDLTDSGRTLLEVKKYLSHRHKNANIKTAVIWNKSSNTLTKPDYYVSDVGSEWIVQPFEKYGD